MLLLVVLSLLMLFSLVAVTFVLLSSRHLETTRYAVKNEQTGDNPRTLLDEVFAQCIRGTNNPNSVLRPHSLLEDAYGNDGISYSGPTTAAPLGTSLPVLTITVTPTAAPPYGTAASANMLRFNAFPGSPPVPSDRPPNFALPFSTAELQTPHYMNGRIFTAIGGAADGRSTRIVGWSFTGASYTINVLSFEGVTNLAVQNDPPTGFVINGRPFSGTGFGFNPQADPATAETLLNASQTIDIAVGGMTMTFDAPYALLPNPVFFEGESDSGATVTNDTIYTRFMGRRIFGGIGGADEDYDAPDAQNMLLAYVPLNSNTGGVSRVIPSLHRPEMLEWLKNHNRNYTANPTPPYGAADPAAQSVFERQASLRPNTIDHDQFPKLMRGGIESTSFADAYDVDNDGDGVTDSIWVDAGLPVRTATDGRMYKPLVAILCVDLDGRLNVNAHGSIAQTNNAYQTPISPGMPGAETLANYLYTTTGTAVPVTMQRGQGTGPAEINLRGLFPSATDYLALFKGKAISGVEFEGRYGEWNGVVGTYQSPLPGRSTGTTYGPDDYLAQIVRYGRPTNYFGAAATGYGSPGDLWGRMAVGLDYAGQPVYSYLNSSATEYVASTAVPPENELPHDPYAINLMRSRATQNVPTPGDNLFTVAELERLLRLYDGDTANLPPRLRALLSSSTLELSKLITTDSFDMPAANPAPSRDTLALLRSQNTNVPPFTTGNRMPPPTGILDLARARIAQQLTVGPADTQVTTALNTLITNRVIAPELIAGEKFDINRPFGNGVDDNGNGVVDEPGEYSTAKEVPTSWSSITGFTPPTFMDLNRDGQEHVPTPPDERTEGDLARQEYAQQLYLLMMLVSDQTYMWAKAAPTAITPEQQREITARQIAQWAINVVDFRDPDAIMTGFEYDANPFNGWDVDGDIRTPDPSPDRRVVWGAEFPEILLTETLALHDRRVSNTSLDNGSSRSRIETLEPERTDPTLDQTHLPQGSAFFELMNMRQPNPGQHYPRELYRNGTQLDLGQLTDPDDAGTVWPVWRIAITESINNPQANITERAIRNPDSTGFDPVENDANKGRFSIFGPGHWGSMVTVERIVLFSTQPPGGTNMEPFAFFNRSHMPTLLQPGGIALVGPRPVTSVGTNGAGGPGSQRILLAPNVEIFNQSNPGGYFANHPSAVPPLGIVCSSVQTPTGWTLDKFPANHKVGVNVTEPMPAAYYAPPPQGTFDNALGQPPAYTTPLDIPLDSSPTASESGVAADLANGMTTILHTGGTANYKHAILQRLANPLKPFQQATNPYISVDWQPIPLVMFNGEAIPTANQGTDNLPWDRDDPEWGTTPPGTLDLANYGRGLMQIGAAMFNPWGNLSPVAVQNYQNSLDPKTAAVPFPASNSGGSDVFPYEIPHTLGYLNKEIGEPWAAANPAIYRNVPNPTSVNARPYPWLTWNNRPFVSEAELMLVPAASAEEMLRKFTAPQNTTDNPYLLDPNSYHLPFGHLFNFRLSSSGTTGSAPNYARVLEYLHVPSPFLGTETMLNGNVALDSTILTNGPSLLAPFNRVSKMREPGRININTIPADPTATTNPVWDAIRNTQGVQNPGPNWDAIVAARRGTTGNLLDNTTFSSFFARPFRGASGAAYALPGTLPGAPPGTPISEIESTFLRPATTSPSQGLFEDVTTTQLFNDPVRNAYFRNEPILKTRNLLTTRSNVYAIWITVGYFEVRTAGSSGPGTPFPDGYQLFGEMGSDTGEIKRHRAFYIYDRSIPVAFERGKDHNMADGILLKRFIE